MTRPGGDALAPRSGRCTGGSWLLWITDLPETPEGEYIGEITVVRFVS